MMQPDRTWPLFGALIGPDLTDQDNDQTLTLVISDGIRGMLHGERLSTRIWDEKIFKTLLLVKKRIFD